MQEKVYYYKINCGWYKFYLFEFIIFEYLVSKYVEDWQVCRINEMIWNSAV